MLVIVYNRSPRHWDLCNRDKMVIDRRNGARFPTMNDRNQRKWGKNKESTIQFIYPNRQISICNGKNRAIHRTPAQNEGAKGQQTGGR